MKKCVYANQKCKPKELSKSLKSCGQNKWKSNDILYLICSTTVLCMFRRTITFHSLFFECLLPLKNCEWQLFLANVLCLNYQINFENNVFFVKFLETNGKFRKLSRTKSFGPTLVSRKYIRHATKTKNHNVCHSVHTITSSTYM